MTAKNHLHTPTEGRNYVKGVLKVMWLLMPCPFTGREMFCAGPNFLSQPKNLTAFSASSKTFVPAQNQFY